jgi:hypothetical protein
MNGMGQDERPGWYAPNKKAERLVQSAATYSKSLVVSRQGSMKEFALPPVSKRRSIGSSKTWPCITTAQGRHSSVLQMFI